MIYHDRGGIGSDCKLFRCKRDTPLVGWYSVTHRLMTSAILRPKILRDVSSSKAEAARLYSPLSICLKTRRIFPRTVRFSSSPTRELNLTLSSGMNTLFLSPMEQGFRSDRKEKFFISNKLQKGNYRHFFKCDSSLIFLYHVTFIRKAFLYPVIMAKYVLPINIVYTILPGST